MRWTRDLKISVESDLYSEVKARRGYPIDPAIDDQGNLFVGWDDQLYCLGPNGKTKGRIQVDLELARIQDPILAPDGTICLRDFRNTVVAIDTRGLLAFQSSARLGESAAIQVTATGVRIGGVMLPVRGKVDS